MVPKRTKQSSITSMGFPLLQKPVDVCVKWDTGGTPSQTMDLQEMVVDGQDNREIGGSSSNRIFFMKYRMPFLQHWYGTFPPTQQDTTTTGTSDVSPPSVGVHTTRSRAHTMRQGYPLTGPSPGANPPIYPSSLPMV
jgi:hypothetical protein